MSNNETGFIKFLMLILVLALTSSLVACQKHTSQIDEPQNTDAIMGGNSVTENSVFSRRVIYLALGVTQSENGSLKQKGLCSASALSAKILLTAAHCIKKLETSQLRVALSTSPWNHDINENEWVQIKKVIVHKDYRDDTENKGIIINDLALVLLADPIPEERISKLATSNQLTGAFNLISIGYGRITPLAQPEIDSRDFKKESTLLNYVMKTVADYNEKSQRFTINQNDFTGVCSGDSGGPGFIYDADLKDFFVVGVTSYISITKEELAQLDPQKIYSKCIGQGNYTNVLYYADWIQNTKAELENLN